MTLDLLYLKIHFYLLEYLEKAKSDILVTHGESHPLYSNTLRKLLDEVNMHEQLNAFNRNKFSNKPTSSKHNAKEIALGNSCEELDRFEDITNQSISGNDGHEKMVAG